MKIFRTKVKEPSLMDQLIDDCQDHLLALTPGTEEYRVVLDNLKELHKLRDSQKSRKQVSPDAIAGIAGNLLGIGMIMGFEKTNVITTKALGMVTKPRI